MGFRCVVVTSLLLLSVVLAAPAGPLDLALVVFVAVAALAVLSGRIDRPGLHAFELGGLRCGEERHLRGSFRRQHRPDAPGRPRPRAPGAYVGAL